MQLFVAPTALTACFLGFFGGWCEYQGIVVGYIVVIDPERFANLSLTKNQGFLNCYAKSEWKSPYFQACFTICIKYISRVYINDQRWTLVTFRV